MPWQCRFVSVDPLAGAGHSVLRSLAPNTPYQYAGNQPVIAIDLDGLEPDSTLIKMTDFFQMPIFEPNWADAYGNLEIESYRRADYAIPNSVKSMVLGEDYSNAPYIYRHRVKSTCELVTIQSPGYLAGLFFESYVARRLLDHYSLGLGQIYEMNEQEMHDINPLAVGLNSNGFKIQDELAKMEVGVTKWIEIEMGSAAALATGTLGQFTIQVRGSLTKNSDGYSFIGQMRFVDTFDFNIESEAEKKIRRQETKMQRSLMGEFQNTIGNRFVPGVRFGVLSEWVDVTQNTGDKHFDWFDNIKANSQSNEIVDKEPTSAENVQYESQK